MAPKLKARWTTAAEIAAHTPKSLLPVIIAEDGSKWVFSYSVPQWSRHLQAGDVVWIARRLPVSKQAEVTHELYPVTLQRAKWLNDPTSNYPDLHFRRERRIIFKI